MTKMRPSFAVTSAHREPGGLRRLAFILGRADAWRAQRDPESVNVLVTGDALAGFAFPFAFEKFHVTIAGTDLGDERQIQQDAAELGLPVKCLAARTEQKTDPSFNIIIHRAAGSDPLESLAISGKRLAANGSLVADLRFPKRMSPSDLKTALLARGLRVRAMQPIGTYLEWWMPRLSKWGMKRGGSLSRFLEACDAFVAHVPLVRPFREWLIDVEVTDPTRPFVMHLMPSLGAGGTERLVFELVSRLPANGFQSKAVAMIEGGPMETVFREQGVPIEVVVRRDVFGFSTVRDLVRMFRLQRPHIVHTHLFGADAWGRLAAFIARVPLVVSTEHNINPSYGLIKRSVVRLFAMKTDALVAVSQTVKENMVRHDRLPAKKIKTIVNGIDLTRTVPRGSHPFHDVPRLIMVSRLYPQKDHATLFKALALVSRPWRLQVVGTGPLDAELRALAERLGIASRIEWLGYREDVPQLLAASDLFCFPSRWEGLGLAAIEAAAAGVPMIASDLPALREVLAENDAAFVKPGNVPDWAHAIMAILDDPAAAVMRAGRAVPGIRSRVSIDTMVRAYTTVYRSLLKRKGIQL